MDYEHIVSKSSLPVRVKKELLTRKQKLDFSQKEFIAISTRAGNEGLLVISPTISNTTLSFKSNQLKMQKSNGAKPIICDLCFCWLPRNKASLISFANTTDKSRSHTFYCCAKLNCSENVRELSQEYLVSRAQLREDISIEKRIDRLERSLEKIVSVVNSKSI